MAFLKNWDSVWRGEQQGRDKDTARIKGQQKKPIFVSSDKTFNVKKSLRLLSNQLIHALISEMSWENLLDKRGYSKKD